MGGRRVTPHLNSCLVRHHHCNDAGLEGVAMDKDLGKCQDSSWHHDHDVSEPPDLGDVVTLANCLLHRVRGYVFPLGQLEDLLLPEDHLACCGQNDDGDLSMIFRVPDSCHSPMSPVCSQPSVSTASRVRSGSLQR